MSAGKKINKHGTTRRAVKAISPKTERSTKSGVRGKIAVGPASKGGRKTASTAFRAAVAAPISHAVRPTSKLAIVISMLRQRGGATIDALCRATDWQAHSVRGALSGSLKKKLGLTVTSDKSSGVRTYRVAD
jgi:Protein of unknown function (DUF3489)